MELFNVVSSVQVSWYEMKISQQHDTPRSGSSQPVLQTVLVATQQSFCGDGGND